MAQIKYWTCDCGFGGNLWYDDTCRGCHAPQPTFPPRHQKPRDYEPPRERDDDAPTEKDKLL